MESSANSSKSSRIFEGFKDGKLIKIFIEEIPKNRYEEAADNMCTYFIADEAMCKSENVQDDPLAIKEFRSLFLFALEDGLSVGAFVDNPHDEKPILAGLNVLFRGGKEKHLQFQKLINDFKSQKVRRIMKALGDVGDEVNVENIYGTENYIGGLGLSVDPSFRGNAIGYHLLLARNEIGKKYGLQITLTVFTSPISVKLADRAGFITLVEKLREELVDENGEILVPNCKTESFKYMGKRLP